ncbi:hypothetical protein PN465_06240 [Nodularia spumigena CS-584]|jgi:hypothetical protein|uniref:Glycosyltransferase RgtA/B/C/D-like domain-containing protein n=2 Tax=Nodularia spumigena TaxID=70799 RepID=A0ABU5UQJ6_NODSP|nr:hypothetical protein [Nodularia spumigena]EAW46415.1 hypothetical protein N9414_06819 [Nodularia spumigena CCY9414]MDB9381823.1 hypothetical protein [Nodularia spumigena CS-584]MEA5526005.1 hypothetical protein [Nodularia spumigena UHCC 0143]MEA5608262.1 hypothetical protein [Nodularia spumigena UHCC 0060]
MLLKKAITRIPRLSLQSPWLIIIIFSTLSFIGILNHSMWRDELNPWLIVRDSESFGDLIANIHYEGHPVLWYFCLAVLRQIAENPVIMQLFHLAIAISSVTIFCLYSPFNYQQKFLFSFGFFPFYEYLVISRNYAFSMLFLFAACTVYSSRKKTYVYLAILLGLLANSSAYALFVSFSLLLTLLVEFCFDIDHRNQYFSQSHKYDLFLSLGIIIFSLILSVYIISPPADSYLHGGLNDGWVNQFDLRHLLRSLGRLFGGYLLIIPTHKRWLDLIVCGLIILFIVALTVIKLSKNPLALFFYIIGNSVILAFTYLRFLGQPRHFGHFYLIFLAGLWLGSYYQESTFFINKFSLKAQTIKFAEKWHYIAFMLILYVQFIGGIGSFTKDLIIPFSASRETANYIKKNQLNDQFIVASRDANMAAISGYLGRKLYYPEREEMGSFTLFKAGRKDVEQPEILKQITSLLTNQPDTRKILLILNKKLNESRQDLKIVPIQNFEKAWVDDERYYLYWVNKV